MIEVVKRYYDSGLWIPHGLVVFLILVVAVAIWAEPAGATERKPHPSEDPSAHAASSADAKASSQAWASASNNRTGDVDNDLRSDQANTQTTTFTSPDRQRVRNNAGVFLGALPNPTVHCRFGGGAGGGSGWGTFSFMWTFSDGDCNRYQHFANAAAMGVADHKSLATGVCSGWFNKFRRFYRGRKLCESAMVDIASRLHAAAQYKQDTQPNPPIVVNVGTGVLSALPEPPACPDNHDEAVLTLGKEQNQYICRPVEPLEYE